MVDKVSFFKEQFSQLTFKDWRLFFHGPVKTSRNTLDEHRVCFVFLHNDLGEIVAIGEIAPIIGLSSESWGDIERAIQEWIRGDFSCILDWPSSMKSAIDMLWQDINPMSIPEKHKINGLVWMNDIVQMRSEAISKFALGYRCIKLKVGALHFEDEINLIKELRSFFGSELTIRLDANGAWDLDEAKRKLDALSRWDIHSIEQPIAAKRWKDMKELIANSPIAVALDEELIGVNDQEMEDLLGEICPEFLVLKPSLHGGFDKSSRWVELAEQKGIKWWATSALESNVGLSHIYRWLGKYQNPLPQGLGTGHLYKNNWDSPLELKGEEMFWNEKKVWRAPWN